MKPVLSIVYVFVPAVALIGMSEILPVTPVPEFLLAETTNGLESSFEYNFVATASSNDARMVSSELVKCPIIMCAPRYDALGALEALTSSEWSMTNITHGCEVMFGRKLGCFSSARVAFFNPPNSRFDHHFDDYGQIESIVSTAIVQSVSFEAGIAELARVKLAFEKMIDKDRLFNRRPIQEGIEFVTPEPTSSGWYIELSATRLVGHRVLHRMILFRGRSKLKHRGADENINIDVDI